MENIPVAGIDVNKKSSDICIIRKDNSVYTRAKIQHTLDGMTYAVTLLLKAEEELLEKPVIVMEATSYYHRFLYQFLTEHGFSVIVINPLQSGGIKNINVRKIKNDKVDAYRLALLYRLDTLKGSRCPDGILLELRELTRQHTSLVNEMIKYKNRLTFHVEQAFPGFKSVFSKIEGCSSVAVLRKWPTPRKILAAAPSDIADEITRASARGVSYGKRKAESITAAAKEAVITAIKLDSSELLIQTTLSVIFALRESLDEIDKEIKRLISENEEVNSQIELLKTIPGIGDFCAAVILSEIGDISLFSKPKQLVAFFGIDPSQKQSGTMEANRNKISKRGSSHLRAILDIITIPNVAKSANSDHCNPAVADYYRRKCLTKPKKVAYCAAMHKMANIIFAVLRDRKPFEKRTPDEHIRLMKIKSTEAA